jgi:hypothetical protein
MIISNLSHFAEVAEADDITGGSIFQAPIVQYNVVTATQYGQSLAIATAVLGDAKARAIAINDTLFGGDLAKLFS